MFLHSQGSHEQDIMIRDSFGGEGNRRGLSSEIPREYSQLVGARKTQRDNRLQNAYILIRRNAIT